MAEAMDKKAAEAAAGNDSEEEKDVKQSKKAHDFMFLQAYE